MRYGDAIFFGFLYTILGSLLLGIYFLGYYVAVDKYEPLCKTIETAIVHNEIVSDEVVFVYRRDCTKNEN